MNQAVLLGLLVAVVIVSVIAVAALAMRRGGSSEAQLAVLRQEMQASLAAQTQAVSTQLGQVIQSLNQQIGQVNDSLRQGLADSGLIASKAQETIGAQLHNSQELWGEVQKKLGEFHELSRGLSQATQTLQTVLSGAKTRGSLGEVALESLLADALPRSAYETQYRFSTGAIVDAIVRTGEKIVSIDSKFPLEAYRRLVDSGEDARKEFFQAVRKHAESISEKYILQNEGTLDIALMFIPSEGVYYELLMTSDAKFGRLDDYCRARGVLPVSPNSLHAYLSAILMGLKGMQVAENARQLLSNLAGLQNQLESFARVYEILGKHLHNAQQSYDEAERKLDRTRSSLEQMAQGSLPESSAKALEASSKD